MEPDSKEKIGAEKFKKEDEKIKIVNEERKKKYSIEEYDPHKYISQSHDDFVLEKIKSNEIKLKNTEVRQRQQTCTFKDLKKDDVKKKKKKKKKNFFFFFFFFLASFLYEKFRAWTKEKPPRTANP